MITYRDSGTIVRNSNGPVLIKHNIDCIAASCKCFIYGICNDLVDKVVETSQSSISDIHSRSLPDRFKTFKDLNISFIIGAVVGCIELILTF